MVQSILSVKMPFWIEDEEEERVREQRELYEGGKLGRANERGSFEQGKCVIRELQFAD
jgi:hypothetical protein